MSSKWLFLSIWLGLAVAELQGQVPDLLSWEVFRAQVLLSHPAARQARLQTDQARLYQLKARGGFDAKVFSSTQGKVFEGNRYFSFSETGVKFPTRGGLELVGGFQTASGKYLDPSSVLPENGQAHFGFQWNLLQGLLIDERRADIEIARIGMGLFDARQALLLNDLLYEAAVVYWEWVLAGSQLSVYQSGLEQAKIRLAALRTSVEQGDKPAIDTLETLSQVQTREMDVYLASLDWRNAALGLRQYIWAGPLSNDSFQLPMVPDLLSLPVLPVLDFSNADSLVQSFLANHPVMRWYEAKVKTLEVERRLHRELLKPTLALDYKLLGRGWQFTQFHSGEGAQMLANDIKWGMRFSYPLTNRKARAAYGLTQIKIQETTYERSLKERSLEIKMRQHMNEIRAIREQLRLFGDLMRAQEALLEGELVRFEFGESSVFLINTREQRLLDARVKFLKLATSYQKANMGFLWSAGLLFR
jgi:outer membrane protein TolC